MLKQLLTVAPSRSSRTSCRCWTRTSLLKGTAWILAAATLSSCAKSEARARRYVDSGNRYIAAQRYEEAVIEYRNALQIDPGYADAHRMLAQAYTRLHDHLQAAREHVRAADILSHDVDLQLKAVGALLELQQFSEARARAETVLRLEPSNVTARVLLGYALAGLKDLNSAVAELEQGIVADGGGARTYTNLGLLQLARGQQKEAEQAFATALALAPKSADVHLEAARWYWAVSRRGDAEAAAKRALELEPGNPRAHWLLAAMCAAVNRAAEAELHLKAAAERAPGTGPQLLLADYYAANGRTSDALRILEPLVRDDRYFVPVTKRIALAEQAAGRHARAQALIDEVLARAPRDRAALTMKVRYLFQEQRLDQALDQLRSAAAGEPQWVDGQRLLGDAYLAKGDLESAVAAYKQVLALDPAAASAGVELAGLYLVAGRVDDAVAEVCRVLQRHPDDMPARLMLARALTARGDLAAAETELRTLPGSSPAATERQTQLATVLLLKGQRDAARRAFDQALALSPNSVEALTGKVIIHLRDHDGDGARRLVEHTLEHSPETPDLLLLAARTYAALGDALNTERMFRRALAQDPGNAQAYEQLGQFYIATHRLTEAQGQFEALAARRPRSVHAQTMIAALLAARQKTAESVQQYRKVLELDPRAAVAANNLAWSYAESGDNLDVASRLAQLAVEQLPDRPEATDTLGWIYCATGRFRDAIPLLQASVRLDPSRAVYHYHLGEAYRQVGDVTRARQSFEAALSRNPKFDQARHALERVTSAGPASGL